jgi:FkbM family methyltransferase
VAFEPDLENVAALRENLSRHYITNVTVIEAGVWRETTRLPFVAEGNMGSALAAVLPRRGRFSERPFLSLSEATARACEASGLHRVAFIKMDIEGAEVAVLETGSEVCRTHRPRIVIEPHRAPTDEEPDRLTTQAVTDLLEKMGYRCELSQHGVMGHLLVLATPPEEVATP